jgi:hypothetical protein
MPIGLLYDELQEENDELAVRLDHICREALNIWEEQNHRSYTAHGEEHIHQVERNLDRLTRPLQRSKRPLAAEEIYVLIAACYLHDIGMQLDDPKAREKHAQYAYDLILGSYAQSESEDDRVKLPINDKNAREAIALISRGHWTTFALDLPNKEFIYGNNFKGRTRLLGVLLAMADLLDMSQIRARYFRSPHQLYELDPEGELHHKTHLRVRGFEISPPDHNVTNDLRFDLKWGDNSDSTRKISEWVLRRLDAQWRQLESVLYEDSDGEINWAEPWVSVDFNSPRGEIEELSAEALNLLEAELAEQKRIDRRNFVTTFREAFDEVDPKVFNYPMGSMQDGKKLGEWCYTQARSHGTTFASKIYLSPRQPLDLASAVSQILEQWGHHLPECTDEEALSRLQQFVSDHPNRSFATIIASEDPGDELFHLLDRLTYTSESTTGARICVVLSDGDIRSSAPVFPFDGNPFSREEVEHYLQEQMGYSPQQSKSKYQLMVKTDKANTPAGVYNYIESHCGLSESLGPNHENWITS